MKESVSNALVFMIVIIVIGICSTIVFFSLGYSRTYKIKSKVIDIIEKNGTYNDATVRTEIEEYLKSASYSSATNKTGEACPVLNKDDGNNENDISAANVLKNYRFCIYEHNTIKGSYYTVRVYMTYNFPVIGDFIKLRYHITGDTRVIFSF